MCLCCSRKHRRFLWVVLKLKKINSVWTRGLAIPVRCSNQLSYEATDVGSRSIVGSYVPMKEMDVNEICYFINIIHKWRSRGKYYLEVVVLLFANIVYYSSSSSSSCITDPETYLTSGVFAQSLETFKIEDGNVKGRLHVRVESGSSTASFRAGKINLKDRQVRLRTALAYAKKFIDDEEFLLLYDAHFSKNL